MESQLDEEGEGGSGWKRMTYQSLGRKRMALEEFNKTIMKRCKREGKGDRGMPFHSRAEGQRGERGLEQGGGLRREVLPQPLAEGPVYSCTLSALPSPAIASSWQTPCNAIHSGDGDSASGTRGGAGPAGKGLARRSEEGCALPRTP